MSNSAALSAVQGEDGPERPDSGFKAVPSATQRLAKLIQQTEEDVLPRAPRQKPIDDPPARREDLRRDFYHRVPKRAEVHPQQCSLFLPATLLPTTFFQWRRQHRHDPIEEQHAVLCQKLRGHAGYYGITGNSPVLARFYHEVLKVWRKWLMRQRAWRVSWDWFRRLLTRYPVPYLRAVQSKVPRRSEWTT